MLLVSLSEVWIALLLTEVWHVAVALADFVGLAPSLIVLLATIRGGGVVGRTTAAISGRRVVGTTSAAWVRGVGRSIASPPSVASNLTTHVVVIKRRSLSLVTLVAVVTFVTVVAVVAVVAVVTVVTGVTVSFRRSLAVLLLDLGRWCLTFALLSRRTITSAPVASLGAVLTCGSCFFNRPGSLLLVSFGGLALAFAARLAFSCLLRWLVSHLLLLLLRLRLIGLRRVGLLFRLAALSASLRFC